MFKTVFAIFAILAISQAAFFRNDVADIQLTADQTGQFKLTWVNGAGYVGLVDYASMSTQTSKQIVLSTYSSKFLLAGAANACASITQFSCAQIVGCKKGDTTSITYPYFTVAGNTLNTNLFLSYNKWAASKDNQNGVLATSCTSGDTRAFGANTVGILGLGFEGDAKKNFVGATKFSVFNAGQQNGMVLVFNPSVPAGTSVEIKTDANWKIPSITKVALGANGGATSGISAILDINSDALGMPLSIYSSFVAALGKLGVNCAAGVYYQAKCTYTGDASKLPNIVLSADKDLQITPTMYLMQVQGAQNQYQLKVKALSPLLSDASYVTEAYKNSFILGYDILFNYYTLFNVDTSSVSFITVGK